MVQKQARKTAFSKFMMPRVKKRVYGWWRALVQAADQVDRVCLAARRRKHSLALNCSCRFADHHAMLNYFHFILPRQYVCG